MDGRRKMYLHQGRLVVRMIRIASRTIMDDQPVGSEEAVGSRSPIQHIEVGLVVDREAMIFQYLVLAIRAEVLVLVMMLVGEGIRVATILMSLGEPVGVGSEAIDIGTQATTGTRDMGTEVVDTEAVGEVGAVVVRVDGEEGGGETATNFMCQHHRSSDPRYRILRPSPMNSRAMASCVPVQSKIIHDGNYSGDSMV